MAASRKPRPAPPKPARRVIKKESPVRAPAAQQEPAETASRFRKKTLVEEAVVRSGQKKRDVKPVVEAVLAILGEALARGEQLDLPPFGKLNVKRRSEKENGEIFTCRIRQPKKNLPDA